FGRQPPRHARALPRRAGARAHRRARLLPARRHQAPRPPRLRAPPRRQLALLQLAPPTQRGGRRSPARDYEDGERPAMRPRRGDRKTGRRSDEETGRQGDEENRETGASRVEHSASHSVAPSSSLPVAPSPRLPVISFLRAWRGTVLGALVVLSGVSAAVITVVARRSGDWELTRLGAIASLLFAVLIVIFVVPPLARSARAEAARLNLGFQVTAGGVVFVSIYTVVAFAAWNTGNNLLFLIFSVLTSTLFVAWTAARASLRDLVVTARFPDHIFAGEPSPVIVTVNNTKRLLPSFSVVVEARSRAEGPAGKKFFRRRPRERKRVLAYFMYVPHRAKVEQRVEQTFERRGRVLVTGFEISTKFPFGFFRLRRRLRARDVEIVVYPKPERAGDELHLLPVDAGQMEAQRRGAGHDLHSLREYQPRDDVRHIDWKATAR